MKKTNLDEFEPIFGQIMRAIEGTTYKAIPLSQIDPTHTVDIRIDRGISNESSEVANSVERHFLKEISPLIVQPIKDTGKYGIIDGKTRFAQLVKTDPNGTVYALILPSEVSKTEEVLINLVINSKRANLSDQARLNAAETLKELGKTAKEAAELLGYSVEDMERKYEQTEYPEEVKSALDIKVSSRKLEEGIGSIYKDCADIVATVEGKKYVDEVVIKQAEEILLQNSNRDGLATRKIAKKLAQNTKIGFKNNLKPEQVVDLTMPKEETPLADGEVKIRPVLGGTDVICEHPTKLNAVESYIKKYDFDWFINLFCESLLFDKKGNAIKSAIERASNHIGTEKCMGVSLFETATRLEYMNNLEVNYHKGDVYEWLATQSTTNGKGLIFVDSLGNTDSNSLPFIQYLKNKYPKATILFLFKDEFKDFRNAKNNFGSKYCIMNWGIDPVETVEDFVDKFGYKIIWKDKEDEVIDGKSKKRGIYLLKA